MARQVNDLADQIDGTSTTFTTALARLPGRTVLNWKGDTFRPPAFDEPDPFTIEILDFVPQPGDDLFAVYDTDATVDGRVVGYPDDPTGLGPNPPALDDLLADLDSRVTALEGAPVPVGFDPDTILTDENGDVVVDENGNVVTLEF